MSRGNGIIYSELTKRKMKEATQRVEVKAQLTMLPGNMLMLKYNVPVTELILSPDEAIAFGTELIKAGQLVKP